MMQILKELPEHLVQDVLSSTGLSMDALLRALPANPYLHCLAMQALDPSIQTTHSLHIHSLSARAFRRACAAAITKFTNVTALSLRGQMTTEHHLARLVSALPDLTTLDLHDSGVTVTGELAAAISGLSCLESLDLSHNMIEDSLIRIASVLPQPPRLHTLNLDSTISRGWHLYDLAATITYMPELRTLTVGAIDPVWSAARRSDLRQLRAAMPEFVQAMKEVVTLRSLTLNFAHVTCIFAEIAWLFRALAELVDLEELAVSMDVMRFGQLVGKKAAFIPETLALLTKLRLLDLSLSGSIEYNSTMLCSTIRNLPMLEELRIGGNMKVHDTSDLADIVEKAQLLTRVVVQSTIDISKAAALALVTQLAAIKQLQVLQLPIMEWSACHAVPLAAAVKAMAESGREMVYDWVMQPALLGPEELDCTEFDISDEAACRVQSLYLHSNFAAVATSACQVEMSNLTLLELRQELCTADVFERLFENSVICGLTQLQALSFHMGAANCRVGNAGCDTVGVQGLSQLQQLTALVLKGCDRSVRPVEVSSACAMLPQLKRLELQWVPTNISFGVLDVAQMLTVQTLVLESAHMPEMKAFCDEVVLLARLRCLGLTACWFGDRVITDVLPSIAPLMQQHVKLMRRMGPHDDWRSFS